MYHLRTPLVDLNFTGTVSKSLIIMRNYTLVFQKIVAKERQHKVCKRRSRSLLGWWPCCHFEAKVTWASHNGLRFRWGGNRRLLCHDVEEARLLLETQQDGYFDCAEFLAQVGSAVNIFEENCFCLIMHQFIARVGRCTQRTTYVRKQPIMRNSFSMVRCSRWMKMVLQERGVNQTEWM